MKKWICFALSFMLLFGLTSCAEKAGKVNSAKTRDVESEVYTQKDITAAIQTIKREFKKNWKGCTLKEIYYAGDDFSKDYQEFADRNDADEVIVLLSSFYVEENGGDGSLNTDFTYKNWNWILVRTKGGKWVHVDHGY